MVVQHSESQASPVLSSRCETFPRHTTPTEYWRGSQRHTPGIARRFLTITKPSSAATHLQT